MAFTRVLGPSSAARACEMPATTRQQADLETHTKRCPLKDANSKQPLA